MPEVTEPSWVDRYDLWRATAQKNAPPFTLPDGRKVALVRKRTDITSQSIGGRAGVVGVKDTNLNQYRWEWTHSSIFNNSGKPASPARFSGGYGTQDLTREDCIRVARSMPISDFESDELGEGDPWGMPYWAPQKTWFYEERARMYAAAGKPFFHSGTYGGFEHFNGDPFLFAADGNPNVMPNDQRFKKHLQSVANARSSCSYFSLFERIGIGATVKNYADTPDYAADWYRKVYAALVMGKGMGKQGGIGPGLLAYLDWSKIEGLGSDSGDLHNGHYYKRPGSLPATEAHPQVEYGWHMACKFTVGMCLCGIDLSFDGPQVYSPNVTDANFDEETTRWMDSGMEAAYRYAQCSRTAGKQWKELRWRFQGSEQWIEPTQDYTGILDAASAFGGPYAQGANARRGRPYGLFREEGNALDFWLFDASQGQHKRDTIIVQPVPNKEFIVNLPGCQLKQFRESI